jgi:hypothetical protein
MISSGKLVGSGVSSSSGAKESIGLDQVWMISPGLGEHKSAVKISYRFSTRLSAKT